MGQGDGGIDQFPDRRISSDIPDKTAINLEHIKAIVIATEVLVFLNNVDDAGFCVRD